MDVDIQVVQWLNQYVNVYPLFDGFVVVANRYHLFRGVVIVALLWWAWMGSRTRLVTEDLLLVRTLLGLLVSILAARGLQNMLPNRPRPAHDPDLLFQVPDGFSGAEFLEEWSSFPSDHAVVVAALVIAIFHFNRLIGVLALVWGIFVVLFPRVYLGLHYPSDILGGIIVGAVVMLVALHIPLPKQLAPTLTHLEDRYRGLAYAGVIVFSYLCGTMFSDAREVLRVMGKVVEVVSL